LALRRTVTLSEVQVEHLSKLIWRGVHPRQIVKQLYPGQKQQQAVAYRKLRSAIVHDTRIAAILAEETQLTMMIGVGPALRALNARANSRNVQAIKLLLEATGVHNPRVRHEHSGEIKIKFEAPRPTFEQHITDADVVED
jgi:hypothetical protein